METKWLFQAIIMIGLGIIAYFLKDFKRSIDNNLNRVHARIDDGEQELKEFKNEFNMHKENLAKEYVHKDDFIRAMSSVDNKLDKIQETLMSIKRGE
ncbi:MAG: hypothetical protein COA82_06695 [Alkaliphilus sp.]|jgi:uncharacterized protein Yka (UPF0111/DUF47 family)|nr:MAG: hypothetical protein COA82_06695 [Alkaliphilus sp.]